MYASLLADVLAEPGDAARRMVYADALAGAGDPRGELIAVELALAEGRTGDELRARRRALRAEHGAAWWPGLATRHVRTRGGFVDAIAIAEHELEAALALAAREPLRSIELCGAWSPAALARLPVVPELVAHELTDRELRALRLDAVAALDLAGSAISEFRPGPRLERLSIAATEVEELDGPMLRDLDISLPRHGAREVARILAASPALVRLRACAFERFATAATCEALARLPSLARVDAIGNQEPAGELARALPHVVVVSTPPDRASIELVDEALELDRTGIAWLDGARVPLHVRHTQSDTFGGATHTGVDLWGSTQLLVEAIACGAPRVLTRDGCRLEAALLPRDNQVTAAIRITPDAIELELEHYVD